jgi:hypothetical protein
MLALVTSTETGTSTVFSCIGAPDIDPCFKAALKTFTHTISLKDGGGGDTGWGTSR